MQNAIDMNMTEYEKKAAIKKLQVEIDKRCAFFCILTDIKGINTGKKPNQPINKSSN